jgi:hypothetical protein
LGSGADADLVAAPLEAEEVGAALGVDLAAGPEAPGPPAAGDDERAAGLVLPPLAAAGPGGAPPPRAAMSSSSETV